MPNRREFLTALVATSIAGAAQGITSPGSTQHKRASLVPAESPGIPNYWCTWAVQNYMFGQGEPALNTTMLEGSSGSLLAHNAMTEEALFGRRGWAARFYPRVRRNIYLLLDDGWQIGGTATFDLDPVKFPSYKGSSAQRLHLLNKDVAGHGWRGAALWCRNTPDGPAGLSLESECGNAGIHYWKIDIGDPEFDLVRTRNRAQIPLTLEHVHSEPPVNGDWKKDGRFGPQPWNSRRMDILRHTDVYRTYDVTSILSLPTTLDRASELLSSAAGHHELHSLLNVEDEVYVAAVLGCTMGVMRHPLHGLRPQNDVDLFFNGQRRTKQRIDEVVRALRWQRIAAPYPCGMGTFHTSSEILRDGWTFSAGETWQHELVGQTVWQSAPAVLARNIDLPGVQASGSKPFVFAARFPNGAVAIGAQERTQPGSAWRMNPAKVTLHVGDASGPFGIFGEYEQLTLVFDKPQKGKRVLAQDLAGDTSIDVTRHANFDGASVHFDGSILRTTGLFNRTPGDLSSPGAVIALV
ncbi:hypothetical protein GCM10011507_13200 [Edaphobacter acidisoli]|uniref:Uncharacterized protein n=1 Tax=Edaphobacter acidisoli TaxID=2040573 RepID=A0A916RND6_9BACT|nr:hypothetical protein [Edaphobacter acidisoli]GGA62956.1 hypothetical protein GCM10011507_13200 [Edaphobacter acidisoli]